MVPELHAYVRRSAVVVGLRGVRKGDDFVKGVTSYTSEWAEDEVSYINFRMYFEIEWIQGLP